MELVVRAFPVLPGRELEMRQFAEQLQTTRAADCAELYSRLGIGHESWHVQQHAEGLWVIVITEFAGKPVAAAAREYAESQEAFVRWFKDRVQHVTGVDPDTTPLGPPTELVFHLHGGAQPPAGPHRAQ
jgi:hypothetical protein